MNKDNNAQTPQRVPRPIGTTQLSINSHTLKTEESLNNLKNHLYSHFTNTNYQYLGTPLTISQFANLLSLNINELNNYIYNIHNLSYKLLGEEGQKEIYGVLLNMSLSGVLNDRSAAEQHLHILQQSQGGSYAPFISSEVTKAIAQVQGNTAQMINLLKTLGGNQGLAININNMNGDQVQQNNYLTVEAAQEMIETKPMYVALGKDDKALAHLYDQYALDDMPEVDATKQTGFDTSKEGLNFGQVLEAEVIDEDEAIGHEDRRAIQYEVDLADDDNI